MENLSKEYRRIMDIAKSRTQGKWQWYGNASSKHIYLSTIGGGRKYVMDFSRWGKDMAQPRFQPNPNCGMVDAKDLVTFEVGVNGAVGINNAKNDTSVYRADIRGVECADAKLMAEIPNMLDLIEGLYKCINAHEVLVAALSMIADADFTLKQIQNIAKMALKEAGETV